MVRQVKVQRQLLLSLLLLILYHIQYDYNDVTKRIWPIKTPTIAAISAFTVNNLHSNHHGSVVQRQICKEQIQQQYSSYHNNNIISSSLQKKQQQVVNFSKHKQRWRTKILTVKTSNNQYWEGDDMRWISKLRRGGGRNSFFLLNDWQNQPVRNSIVLINIVVFIIQCINTLSMIQQLYPNSWSSYYLTIIFDTIMGNSRPGPFMLQYVYTNNLYLPLQQSYRYISSGFLHGSILHLILNMNALRQLPSWLETGLGSSLYITTFLLSIIGGNIGHTIMSTLDSSSSINTFCLGASGGICGLYGLMYICLARMGNNRAAWQVMKGMGFVLLWGMFITNISNAAHVGGFITGIVVTLLCGPSYRSSYKLRRKNSLEVDIYNRDYRTVMGYDKIPTKRNSVIPVPVLWVLLVSAYIIHARFQYVPSTLMHRYR